MNKKKELHAFSVPIKIEIELSEEVMNQIAAKTAVIIEKKTAYDYKNKIKEVWYTVREASGISKKSPDTIARHIRLKLLKASKSGKSWRITKENLENYINNIQ